MKVNMVGDYSYLPERLRKNCVHAEVIGEGSFGQVYLLKSKAVDSTLSSYVLKRISLRTFNESQKAGALDEALISSRLTHPNICALYDFFLEGNYLYLKLEYATGDLKRLISKRKRNKESFAETEILSILAQCCEGLEYVHEKNIIHRDIKAENIFLHKSIAKLGDFGVSKVLGESHAYAETMCGTPYYFSPEIIENRPYGKMTDIWALGCVSYELMELNLPFKGTNLPSLLKKITKHEPKPLPDKYSKPLRQLVNRMLSKQPSKRPAAATILSHKSLVSSTYSDQLKSHITENDSHKLAFIENEASQSKALKVHVEQKCNPPIFTQSSSSLHQRLNQTMTNQNQSEHSHSTRKTWKECLKEAHANVYTTNNIISGRNPSFENFRFERSNFISKRTVENSSRIDEDNADIAIKERRPEGINTLVNRLDALNVNLSKMVNKKTKSKQRQHLQNRRHN